MLTETKELMREHYGFDQDEAKALEIIAINALTDPSVVLSQLRNVVIADTLNPEDTLTNIERQADAVFNIVVVVRNNPAFFATATTEEEREEKIYALYEVAGQCVETWRIIAADSYYGHAPSYEELPVIDYNALPPRQGAPNITIYGTIFDPQGRTTSLTVTDKTVPQEVYEMLPYAFGLYDVITGLSTDKIDLNRYGKIPYRYSTDVSQKRSSSVKSRKSKSKGKKKSKAKETIINKLPFADFVNVSGDKGGTDYGERFQLKVGRVEIKSTKSKTLNFFGFVENAKGEPVLSDDRNHTVYIYEGDNFDTVVNMIQEETGKILSNGKPSLDLPENTIIEVAKLEAQSGATYYRDLTISFA